MVVIFTGVSIIVLLFSYQFSFFINSHSSTQQDLALMSNLMKIIQISQLFFIVGSIITAILQSFQHFLIPGIATSFYNLGIILGMLIFAPFIGIYSAAVGVLLGSMLFCAVQLPLLFKTGFRITLNLHIHTGIKKFFKLMSPTLVTIIILQISITANVYYALFISQGSYLIFDLAQTLMMGPVLLFGQSIAQASFPSLAMNKNNRLEFISIFTSSFNQILYLTLPISAILIVLRVPIVRLFFGARGFDWDATVATGLTLSFFAISIFSQSLLFLVLRAFYAFQDTQKPFYITCFSVVFNVIFSYILIVFYKLPIYFLAVSSSAASIFSVIALLYFINKRISLPKKTMFFSIFKIITAASVMGVALYIPIKLLDKLVFDTTRTINLLTLTGIASLFGFITYVFFTWLLDIQEAYYIIKVAKNVRNKNKILKQIGELIDGPKTNS